MHLKKEKEIYHINIGMMCIENFLKKKEKKKD